MIASPVAVLGTMRGTGILSADLDLAYVRRMRSEPEFPDGVTVPAPFATLPGLEHMRRPELFDDERHALNEPLGTEAAR